MHTSFTNTCALTATDQGFSMGGLEMIPTPRLLYACVAWQRVVSASYSNKLIYILYTYWLLWQVFQITAIFRWNGHSVLLIFSLTVRRYFYHCLGVAWQRDVCADTSLCHERPSQYKSLFLSYWDGKTCHSIIGVNAFTANEMKLHGSSNADELIS